MLRVKRKRLNFGRNPRVDLELVIVQDSKGQPVYAAFECEVCRLVIATEDADAIEEMAEQHAWEHYPDAGPR